MMVEIIKGMMGYSMGVKSKVRSMQRGAHYRDSDSQYRGPLYNKSGPTINNEDEIHLGLNDKTREQLYAKIQNEILNLNKLGYRKPKDICKFLNKHGYKTIIGHRWTPRLTYFLLEDFYEWKKLKSQLGCKKKQKNIHIQTSSKIKTSSKLTEQEMQNRILALQKFYNRSNQ